MADQNFVLAPATATVSVNIALEPAFNILNSLSLLSHPEERSGFNPWINQTDAKLSPELAHNQRLIFKALGSALEPDASWPSFPAFINYLAAEDADVLRDKAVRWMCEDELDGLQPLDRDIVLTDQG